MVTCAFSRCKNNSRNTNKSKGVTFHMFPKEPFFRQRWVKILQKERQDDQWLPTKYSRICSVHFGEEYIDKTPLGHRRINVTGIPNVWNGALQLQSEEIPANTSQSEQTSYDSYLGGVCDSDTEPNFDTPRANYVKNQLVVKNNRKHNCKEIPKLKQNKYLKSKSTSLQELIKSLKKRKFFNEENFNELSRKAEDANKEFLQTIITKTKTMSLTLRKFYLTLHYYSPAAYKYVRGKFNNLLPHLRTLEKWYEKSDASPGFTKQAFDKLLEKCKDGRIIATLVGDEMALRQRTTWNGRKTLGLVDEGLGEKYEIATQVYVFMLVSNTENWKIPLGYFFINGLQAEQRANLINVCINKCYDVGVDVIALTFEDCSANVATAEVLGCDFKNLHNLQTTFPSPSCSNNMVAVLFDSAHMLKLVRNTFEAKKILLRGRGHIEWAYLVKLQKLQEKKDFEFANRLTVRHITFRHQIMKVNLAGQLISRSVAKVLSLCSEILTGDRFRDVEETVKFLELFNDLFDVFNSRIYNERFKQPLSEKNEIAIMKLLDEAETYIKSLKVFNKVKIISKRSISINIGNKLVTKAKCKMGFLGFLINIQSLKYLYAVIVKEKKLISSLSMNRFSLDNIELFFDLIRQHGRPNNDPTTEQFRRIYRNILYNLELRHSYMGNCLPIDNFTIKSCSSSVDKINLTTPGYCESDDALVNSVQPAEDQQCEVNTDILSNILDKEPNMIDLSRQIVGYISGWVVKKIFKEIQCDTCCGVLASDQRLTFHKLITLRNLGGVILPAQDVYNICLKTESILKLHVHRKMQGDHYVYKENEYKILKAKILKTFVDSNVFNTLSDHALEQPATWNHKILLIKSIIQCYSDVRLHYIHKNLNKTSSRWCHNKLVLF